MEKAVIERVSSGAIGDEVLNGLIARSEAAGVPDSRFARLLARVPGYAEALHDALERSRKGGAVDHRLKEIIRVQIARLAGDPSIVGLRSKEAQADGLTEELIEAGCGDFAADARFSAAKKLGLCYGWLMFREPKRFDKDIYDEGKTHYSETEIMELGAFIAFHYGMQIFFGTLALLPEQPRSGA